MPPPPTLDAKPRPQVGRVQRDAGGSASRVAPHAHCAPRLVPPQHPLYSTANSAYGSKQASEFEKIEQWHGQKARLVQALRFRRYAAILLLHACVAARQALSRAAMCCSVCAWRRAGRTARVSGYGAV